MEKMKHEVNGAMRSARKAFCFVIVFAVMFAALAACDKPEEPPAPEPTPSTAAEVTAFTAGEINGDALSAFAAHDVTEFDFSDKITVSPGASWKLFKGGEEVADKRATDLADGDNNFAIEVTAEDGVTKKNYTATIYKSYSVTITFYVGEDVYRTENAYTGIEFTIETVPDLPGYAFDYWENEAGERTEKFTPWSDVDLYAAGRTLSAAAEVTAFTAGEINGDSLSAFAAHDVTELDLSDKITVSAGATWKLLKGSEEVADRHATNFANGDNEFAVEVTAEDGVAKKTYTLTIYKSFAVTVTFYDGDDEVHTDTAYTREEYAVDYVPVLPNKKFEFWKDAGGNRVTALRPEGDVSLYAEATPLGHTVTLVKDGDGGDASTNGTLFTAGEECTLTATVNDGFLFLGFYKGETLLAAKLVWSFVPDSDVTITAKWSPLRTSYTVVGEGSVTGSVPTEGTVGDAFTLTAEASRPWYEFEGWYKDGDPVASEQTLEAELTADETVYEARFGTAAALDPFEVEISGDACVVTGVIDRTATSLAVPDYVTEIRAGALGDMGSLTELSLPFVGKSLDAEPSEKLFGYVFGTDAYDGGEKITQNFAAGIRGAKSFYIPTGLKKVKIADGGVLGYGAFYSIKNVTEIEFVHISEVGENSFFNCVDLEKVILPGATSIGNNAFKGCVALARVEFGDELVSIGEGAFDNTGLAEAVFAVTEGWSVDGEPIDPGELSDAAKAAAALKNNIGAWTRS